MKFDVPPEIWQKFHQLSSDVGRDVNEVFAEIVLKAHAEFEAAKAAEEVPVVASEE